MVDATNLNGTKQAVEAAPTPLQTDPVAASSGETSDAAILNLLRRRQTLGIAELVRATGVTATAVRQRLSRLLAEGLIERESQTAGRGRPSHRYRLTAKGQRGPGSNFADLAIVLWDEVRQITDPEVKRGLLRRLAARLADSYSAGIKGASIAERMESVRQLFAERDVPLEVETTVSGAPALVALACPYPDLAEADRGICGLERMLFSDMLGQPLRLASCRLDGETCCRFELSPTAEL